MFEHYIITRFNLRKDAWKASKNNNPVLTKEWLSNRFELFDNYCFPTIKNQTNLNFKWLVFFDTNTPTIFKDKIRSYKNNLPNFSPIYVDGMSFFLPTIQEIIGLSKSKYIITSRIDNDDSISKHYVEEVQNKFAEQEYMGIDFADGYTLQINPNFKIGYRKQVYNPFISLIEKNENPKSVWSKTHSDWKREKQVTRVTNKKVWMNVIHFENKVNEFAGYGEVDLNDIIEEFALNKNIIDKLIPVSQWKLQSLKNKVSSHWRTLYKDFKRKAGLY